MEEYGFPCLFRGREDVSFYLCIPLDPTVRLPTLVLFQCGRVFALFRIVGGFKSTCIRFVSLWGESFCLLFSSFRLRNTITRVCFRDVTIPYFKGSKDRIRLSIRCFRSNRSTCGSLPASNRANSIRTLIRLIIMIIRVRTYKVRRRAMDFFHVSCPYDRGNVRREQGEEFICNTKFMGPRITASNFPIRVFVVRRGSRRRVTLLSMTQTRGPIP